MTTDKGMPASIDAERATLGSILLNREAIVAIAPWLQPEAFYLEANAWVYAAMVACYNRRVPPDLRMVADELRRANKLETIGGIGYLVELTDATPTSYHVEHYARVVLQAATRRAIISAGAKIAALGYDEQDDDADTIANCYAALDAATQRPNTTAALLPLSVVADARYEEVHTAIEGGSQVQTGIMTGLRDFDEITGGLHKSDLVVVAARPSVGKSSWALTVAKNIAERGQRIDIFSLEMSRQQNLDRLIAMRTGMNLMDVRQLALDEAGLGLYMAALGWAHKLPIAIDDQPSLTLHDIRTRLLRRQAEEGPPAVVMIDYLGLMRVPKARSRYDEVSEIARGLKNLAKELDVPVVAFSQLSRAVEGRNSHVPMLSDLRESGEIEQSADIVMFIYREELYEKDTDKKGIAELHIAKHRHGPIGVVVTRFDGATTQFLDHSYRSPEGY